MRLLKSLKCTYRYERLTWKSGARLVAGVDEAGRGCLFGPVVAAAVILDPEDRLRGLRDSKLIPRERRELLSDRIKERAVAFAWAAVDAETIDSINIYQASRLAMRLAVEQLTPAPEHLLVDAVEVDHPSAEARMPQTCIIHGDALSATIAAASIVAKVQRDAMLRELALQYPEYDLASNKGYASPKHREALLKYGPTPLHRRSFAPVWEVLHPQEQITFLEAQEA